MSNPLTSVLKFQPKLRQCLIADSAHIGLTTNPPSNRRGRHVQLIKIALNAFARRQGFPELDESNDLFDQETADFVETFKRLHRPPILNFANKIDAIVGKKTIQFLDDELPFQR